VELYLQTHTLLIATFLITGKISPLKTGGNKKDKHNKFINNSNNLKTVSSLSKQ
jgi:hypothetical protein